MLEALSRSIDKYRPQKPRKTFEFALWLLTAAFFLCPSYALFLIIFYALFLPSGFLWLWYDRPHWLASWPMKAAYAFLFWGAVTLLFSVKDDPRWCFDLFEKTIVTSFFLILTYTYFSDPGTAERYMRFSVPVILAGATLSMTAYFLRGEQWLRLQPLAQAHNPILGACVYGLFSLFALSQALTAFGTRAKLLAAAAVIASAALILLTQSKGPIVATVAAYGVMLTLMIGRRHSCIAMLFVLAVVFGAGGYFFLPHAQAPQSPTKDNSYAENLAGRGLSYRPQIWTYTLEEIKKYPLVGVGLAAPFNVTVGPGMVIHHPHNLYLATLYYTGIIGFLLEMAMFFAMGNAALKSDSPEWGMLACAITIYVLLCMASDIVRLITSPKELMFLYWLPFAMLIAHRRRAA